MGSNVEFDDLCGQTMLSLRRFGLSQSSQLLKRAFDLVGASTCLVVLAPLLDLVALAVKLHSPGPVLFRRTRIGRDGEPFSILKFRSMEVGAAARKHALAELNETAGLFKMAEDPRVNYPRPLPAQDGPGRASPALQRAQG